MPSLQRRFLATSGFVLLTSIMVAGFGGYRSAIVEANEILDNQLAQLVQTLLFLIIADNGKASGDIGVGDQSGHALTVFQIWKLKESGDEFGAPSGGYAQPVNNRPYPQLLLRSGEMDAHFLFDLKDGFSTVNWSGHTFRIYARASPNGEFRAIVGQDMIDREEMLKDIALSNVRPYIYVLPLGILALALVAYQGLAPIRKLTKEVSTRAAYNLDHFLIDGTPQELRPLLQALNMLLDRLNAAIENEKRFTGDAAHELRTPIAALHAQLDALRLADNKDTRIKAQGQAAATTERLGRLVNQLLTLAKLDIFTNVSGTRFDLAELARESCGEIAPAAVAKGIELSLYAKPADLTGEENVFRILFRNLLENALRYAPSGGRVEVHLEQGNGYVRLTVADNGPGVSSAEMGQLGQRFHRLSKSDATGVGLGLSIVLRIVEHYRGETQFGPGLEGKGLAVTMTFPSHSAWPSQRLQP
jgi:two-component system sensor histidine kinase QseC